MAYQRPILTDFTAGEISTKFNGRFDLPIYTKGCETVENWVPFAQGGIRSRPGTQYLAATKSGAKARMIPFVVSESNAFILEFTNNLIRIWKDGALVGSPTEVVSTYTTAQLFQIQYQKVRNILYLVHSGHVVSTLTWNGGTSFTLAALSIEFGTGVSAWQATTAYSVDDVVSNGSPMKLYVCITAGTSAGSGGPTTEADDITDNTAHWYWEATKPFSQASDYPVAIAHFQGRMYYAGTINAPQTIWASEPYWYGSFNMFNIISITSTTIDDASGWSNPLVPETSTATVERQVFGEGAAFFFEIASDEDDDIYWLMGVDALIIGTASREWVIPPDVNALNVQAFKRSGIGSAYLQPQMFQDAPVFASGTINKAQLREYGYKSQSAELESPDLTFGADHMLENGVAQMAIMRMPQPTLFCVTNGELACLVYQKVYGVMAWYHITTAGTTGDIESVAVVPGSTDDEVYISVNRAGGRVIEKLDLLWNTTNTPLDSYVDEATAGATTTGLGRFASEIVTIWNADDLTVHSGTVSAGGVLTHVAADVGDHIVVGMPFTAKAKTMRLNTTAEDGNIGHGVIQRTHAAIARVRESLPFKVGYKESQDLEITRRPDGQPWTAAFTGDVHVPFAGSWDRDVWVWLVQDLPYRTTVLALIPEIDA